MNPKYKLLQDLPDAKAGTILTWDGNNCYDYESSRTGQISESETMSWYRKEFVEATPEWFTPITIEEEVPFVWTDELVGEYGEWYRKEQGSGWKYLGWDRIEAFKDYKGIKQPVPPTPSEYKGVESRDWQIVSFRRGFNENLTLKNGKYRSDVSSISDMDFLLKNCSIVSVKRLSDGVVFSIGDEVCRFSTKQITETINKFVIEGEKGFEVLYVHFNESATFAHFKFVNKISAPEDKPVLFTETKSPTKEQIIEAINNLY